MKDSELNSVLLNKGLAELGDSLINFIYSAAKSKVLGKFCGERVSNKVLIRVLDETGLRKFLPRRIKPSVKSNAIEALIAYAWISNFLSINEAIEILASKLDLSKGEFEASVNAIVELVNVIKRRIDEN